MIKKIDVLNRGLGLKFSGINNRIDIWAPKAKNVQLKINNNQTVKLKSAEYGFWSAINIPISIADEYILQLETEQGIIERPDPVSLRQAKGVHQESTAFDVDAFKFSDESWKGIPLADYIIYELHIGTFSPDGTFLGAINKLDHLLELGINAVEVMPLSSFPGERNWGYDGVFPFAVQESYGGPTEFQHFVNECHNRGIAVILDVVYNHFGPEGNYLPDFGNYFTAKYKTPWGEALNFDDAYCDGVRNYFIENVLMWLRDFHVDALRLDAVHAINDFSATHILAEIKAYVAELSSVMQREYHLIAECDLNDVKYLESLSENGYGMDAQWADDFHHALRVTAGEPRLGYYKDFNGIADLAKSYKQAFVYDGNYSAVRRKCYGSKPIDLAGNKFIVCSQNHDQVGNRMLGERSLQLYGFEMCKVLATAVLFSPFVPMLFMGEEWGETNPFQYFVSHGSEELIEAVRKGRANEFESFNSNGEAPDPQSEKTFLNSKLQWELLAEDRHQKMFSFYKDLIALRRLHPALRALDLANIDVKVFELENVLLIRRWQEDEQLICLINFSPKSQNIDLNFSGNWNCLINSSSVAYFGNDRSEHQEIPLNKNFNILPQSALIFEHASI